MVFDGAAKFQGSALNDAVLSGVNLLNNLLEVLTRFPVGKYASMANLSKCFFEYLYLKIKETCFVRSTNNNVDGGNIHLFQFTRHCLGINPGLYIVLFAI